jgi:hypothetical protein
MGGGSPPRGGAGRLRRGPEAADEVDPVLLCWVGLTRLEGFHGPSSRVLEPSGEGGMFRSSWPGRVRDPRAWQENASER